MTLSLNAFGQGRDNGGPEKTVPIETTFRRSRVIPPVSAQSPAEMLQMLLDQRMSLAERVALLNAFQRANVSPPQFAHHVSLRSVLLSMDSDSATRVFLEMQRIFADLGSNGHVSYPLEVRKFSGPESFLRQGNVFAALRLLWVLKQESHDDELQVTSSSSSSSARQWIQGSRFPRSESRTEERLRRKEKETSHSQAASSSFSAVSVPQRVRHVTHFSQEEELLAETFFPRTPEEAKEVWEFLILHAQMFGDGNSASSSSELVGGDLQISRPFDVIPGTRVFPDGRIIGPDPFDPIYRTGFRQRDEARFYQELNMLSNRDSAPSPPSSSRDALPVISPN